MEQLICTYALVKSINDQGGDYIDSFLPFALKAFIGIDVSLDMLTIQNRLKGNFQIDIPLHVIKTIMKRAKKRRFIQRDDARYQVTQNGRAYLDKLEDEKDIERRINELVSDVKIFYLQKNKSVNEEEIKNFLFTFIKENIIFFADFIGESTCRFDETSIKLNKDYTRIFIEYIKYVEHSKAQHYNTIRDIILGSIISAILCSASSEKINDLQKKHFKKADVYLDSNFVISLLDLRSREFTLSAEELISICTKNNFSLKIFDFTVHEICRVVTGYLGAAHKYPSTLKIGTFYSSLKRKGWKATQVREFVTYIEDILKEKGVEVVETKINLDKYRPSEPMFEEKIGEYKPEQNTKSRNHDLAALDLIMQKRKKYVRKIEDSKGFFLTSDLNLCKYNSFVMGHKEHGTIAEAIFDRHLANILWLKNPSLAPPMKVILSAYTRELFIKRSVWDKFYSELKELKASGKISDDFIANMFYKNYLEDILIEIPENNVDSITPEFVIDSIEKIAQIQRTEGQKHVEQVEQEFIQMLDKNVGEAKETTEKKWIDRINGIKTNIRKVSDSRGNIYATLIALSGVVAIIVGCLIVIYIFESVGLNAYASIIAGSVTLGSIFKYYDKIKSRVRNKISNIIYFSRLKEINIDSIVV